MAEREPTPTEPTPAGPPPDGPGGDGPRRLSRRTLLIGGAAGGVAVAGAALARVLGGDEATPAADQHAHSQAVPAPTSTSAAGRPAVAGAPWSDPDSWPDGVPGEGDVARVSKTIVLDQDAKVAGVEVGPEGRLVFDPAASRRLESTGNVVVKGQLVMRPASAAVEHRLTFTGVREARFAGGGMEVKGSDVGLWVMDRGTLDLKGASKLSWTRAEGALAAGANRITLRQDPTGWRKGDELVVAPTVAPTDPDSGASTKAYDTATVAAVRGRTVTLSRPLRFAHPAVTVDKGRTLAAEVLNLTRNVALEGTAGGRAHVFVRAEGKQSLAGVAIRHMGPRQPAEEFDAPVVGRYPLHFHMAGNGSRGSVVSDVVVRDSGGHAFVTHLSNGVTYRDCISHDTMEDAYWWDPPTEENPEPPPTDDVVYDRCVASLVRHEPEFRGYRLAGFFLGAGSGNVVKDCVAVGVRGSADACGFIWPEGSEGIWVFHDNVAHNNTEHGIFTWQNTGKPHLIERFVAYHNTRAGISHGAYNNGYEYRTSVLFGNAYAALAVHAQSNVDPARQLKFEELVADGAGLSDYLVRTEQHNGAKPELPTRYANITFRGARKAAFGWLEEGKDGESAPDVSAVIDCNFSGNEFWMDSGFTPGSRIEVRDRARGSLLLQPRGETGQLQAKWNVLVQRG
jgi:G8 domain